MKKNYNYCKVENLTSPRTGRAVPNQFIINTKNGSIFQSYNSVIAISENMALTLGRDWDYSNTTLKYLKQYILEYWRGLYRDIIQNEKTFTAGIKKAIQLGKIQYDENLQ